MQLHKDPVNDREEFVERVNATFPLHYLATKYAEALLVDDLDEQKQLREQARKIKACRDHYIVLYDAALDEDGRRKAVQVVSCNYEPTQV